MDRRPSPGKSFERRRDTDEDTRPPAGESGKQLPDDDSPGLSIQTPIQIPSPIGVAGNASGYEDSQADTAEPIYVDPDATDLDGPDGGEQELFENPPPDDEDEQDEPDYQVTPGGGSSIGTGAGEPADGPQITIGTGGGSFGAPGNEAEPEDDDPAGSIEVDLNPEREPIDPGDRLPKPGEPPADGEGDGKVPANEPTEEPELKDGGSDSGSPGPVSDPEPTKPESGGSDAPTTADAPTGSAGGTVDSDDVATGPGSSSTGPATASGSGGAAGGAAEVDAAPGNDEDEDEEELEPIDFSVKQDPPDEPEKEAPDEEQETKGVEDEASSDLTFDASDTTAVDPLSLDREDFDFSQEDLSQEEDDDFDDLP